MPKLASLPPALLLLVLQTGLAMAQPDPGTPAEGDQLPVIAVSTVEELLAAIDSHRILELAPGTYSLGALTLPEGATAHYTITAEGDPAVTHVTIHDVQNLHIRGPNPADGPGPYAELVQPHGALSVLTFTNVQSVELTNLGAGHGDRVEECTGGVLVFDHSNGIQISGSRLYGSGSVGISVDSVSGLVVEGTTITGCSYGAFYANASDGLRIAHSAIVDNAPTYWATFLLYASNLDIEASVIRGNHAPDQPLFDLGHGSMATLTGCTVADNAVTALSNAPERLTVVGGEVTEAGPSIDGGSAWLDTTQMAPLSPSLALLRGDAPSPDDTPALVLDEMEPWDPRLEAVPEAACWAGQSTHDCATYTAAVPAEMTAALTYPAQGSFFLVGTGTLEGRIPAQPGLCQPTYGELQLVAYVRGCENRVQIVLPLLGCPGPVAPFTLSGSQIPADLAWMPAVDGPIEQPIGPGIPSDPLHRRIVEEWMAANPIPEGAQSVETRALHRTAQAASESVDAYYAGVNIHNSDDVCENEQRGLHSTGLRTADGTFRAFDDSGLLSGVLTTGGKVTLVVMDDGGYVSTFRRTGPADFAPWFDGSYFDENDECETWGSPVDYPFPCGP